jgi:hypothetical protein
VGSTMVLDSVVDIEGTALASYRSRLIATTQPHEMSKLE